MTARTPEGVDVLDVIRATWGEDSPECVAVAGLVAAAEKAKAALLTGQIGHIANDVGVYHLEGPACGNALNALRAALSRMGAAS